MTFGISIGLTAVALVVERNEGLLDRSWVAGVNVTELLISQVVTQLIIIIVQISLMVSITLWGFKVCLVETCFVYRARPFLALHPWPVMCSCFLQYNCCDITQVYNARVYNVWLIGLLAMVQGLTGIIITIMERSTVL
jgi:hypothetical protein